MSRYIDADNAIERLGAYLMTDAQIEYGGLASEDIEDWKPIAIDILKGAPSIDIVKCADCKYDHKCNHSVQRITSKPDYMSIVYVPIGWCERGERYE